MKVTEYNDEPFSQSRYSPGRIVPQNRKNRIALRKIKWKSRRTRKEINFIMELWSGFYIYSELWN